MERREQVKEEDEEAEEDEEHQEKTHTVTGRTCKHLQHLLP